MGKECIDDVIIIPSDDDENSSTTSIKSRQRDPSQCEELHDVVNHRSLDDTGTFHNMASNQKTNAEGRLCH